MNIRNQSERLQTVDRALKVLLSFTKEKPSWGVTELSQEFGLSKSMVHRLLASLQHFDFVEIDPESKKYRLGYKILVLGQIAANQIDIRKISLPEMKKLAEVSGESVILTIRDGMTGVAIEIVEGTQAITWKTSLGSHLPLHCGASKKVLLAFQTPEFIERYLQSAHLLRLSDQSLMEIDSVREELAQIRKEGVAVTSSEVDLGVTAIAAPIFNGQKEIVAGLTIGGPEFRFTPEVRNSLSQSLKDTTARISAKLGYFPGA